MHIKTKGNLKPGMLVSIEGALQPDGSIVATEIKPGLGLGDDKSNDVDKGKGDDKDMDVITATMTITNDHDFDDRVITATRIITGDEDFGDHKVITGTVDADDKHGFLKGDDPKFFLVSGFMGKSPKGSQFNNVSANTNQTNGNGKNGGWSKVDSGSNPNSQGSQNHGDRGGGGGSGRN